MILTGYFDESGTHGGSGLSVMAGFVGDARQWRKFEKRSAKLFKRFRVDVFHTIDVKRSDKDFAGWSVDRKLEFLDEFHHIINETLEFGVASLLQPDDYAYYADFDWPRGTRKDTLYTILFRACLSAVIDGVLRVANFANRREPRLRIVLESGHKHGDDARRLYTDLVEKFGGNPRAMSGLTFADKKNCLPLAAADLFAYSVYGHEVGSKPIGTSKKPTKADASYRGNLYRIPVGREQLEGLHAQALEFKNRPFSPRSRQESPS